MTIWFAVILVDLIRRYETGFAGSGSAAHRIRGRRTDLRPFFQIRCDSLDVGEPLAVAVDVRGTPKSAAAVRPRKGCRRCRTCYRRTSVISRLGKKTTHWDSQVRSEIRSDSTYIYSPLTKREQGQVIDRVRSGQDWPNAGSPAAEQIVTGSSSGHDQACGPQPSRQRRWHHQMTSSVGDMSTPHHRMTLAPRQQDDVIPHQRTHWRHVDHHHTSMSQCCINRQGGLGCWLGLSIMRQSFTEFWKTDNRDWIGTF